MTRLLLLLALTLSQAAYAQSTGLIDQTELEALRVAAEQAHSDAVVLLRNGEPIVEWYFGQEQRPIELMSVLKSVVSLGIGRLLTQGKIDSLDQPIHLIYPEWKQGRKRQITIRQLLNHTSGLQNIPNAGAEIYPSPNAVRLALAAEVSDEPGSSFSYNNKAVNLLSGIVETLSGQRMDQFFVDEFFRPMGIDRYKWYYDQSGTPHAMAGLELHALDLAKFGQLVLSGGMWAGEQLVSAAYIEQMLDQGQSHYPLCGLLWWRLPSETRYVLDEVRMAEIEETGVSAEFVAMLRPLLGHTFVTSSERDAALEKALGPNWQTVLDEQIRSKDLNGVFRREYGEIVAYYGDGYLGQTLMVVPEHGIVAVRQVRGDEAYNRETDGFRAFKELVLKLVRE